MLPNPGRAPMLGSHLLVGYCLLAAACTQEMTPDLGTSHCLFCYVQLYKLAVPPRHPIHLSANGLIFEHALGPTRPSWAHAQVLLQPHVYTRSL